MSECVCVSSLSGGFPLFVVGLPNELSVFSWLVAAATRLDELWQSVERHAAAEKSKILNEQHRTRPPPPPQ